MFSFPPIGSLTDKTICQVEIREAFSWLSGATNGGRRSRGGEEKEVISGEKSVKAERKKDICFDGYREKPTEDIFLN